MGESLIRSFPQERTSGRAPGPAGSPDPGISSVSGCQGRRRVALLECKDEYLLGIESLDFEHRGLFETINELHAQCNVDASLEDVEACLGQFHARLAAHFALEENTMREMHNPYYYEAHKAAHDGLLDEVTEALASLGTGPEEPDIWVVEQ